METEIKIKITNIKVSKQGWYSFHWDTKVDGLNSEGDYDGSYSSQSVSTMRRKLQTGYAVELAIIDLMGF